MPVTIDDTGMIGINHYDINNHSSTIDINNYDFIIDGIEFGIKMSNTYKDDIDSYHYEGNINNNNEWNIDDGNAIDSVSKEFHIIQTEEWNLYTLNHAVLLMITTRSIMIIMLVVTWH